MRPTLLAALLVLVTATLAGCTAEEIPDAAPRGEGDAVPELVNATASGPGPSILLTVVPPVPTQQETLLLAGTVDQPARLLVTRDTGLANDLARPIDVAAGAWNLTVALEPGHTNLTVTADTGLATMQVSVVAVRLVSATFEAVYTAAVPPKSPVSDLVWFDPDGFASAPAYEGQSITHPPHATVHDLMVTWEQQTGKAIVYSYFESLGFSPDRIDGIGQPLTSSAPPYWCYTLNGATADFGISLQALAAGDVVTWEYGACA